VRIPARALAAGRDARIRVAVSDGFDEARVVSRRFRADGTPPQVRIVRPTATEALSSGDRVLLLGAAIDDAHRDLRGHALAWYARGRRVARGARAAARLPAGSYVLRLVARDRTGRAGVARVRVHVRRPELRLLRIAYPLHIAHGARALPVTVAASESARLRARGRAYRVAPRTRRIRLPLPDRPGSGVVRVPVKLVAVGGRHVAGAITVTRR
jgi:hypothetical protein